MPYKMALTAPKKTAAGYYLAAIEPVEAPEVSYADGKWTITPAWDSWATGLRGRLLDALLANPAWFSRTPRREILDPLFGPWSGHTMQGELKFFCKIPDVPGNGGKAVWQFDGLLMSAAEIKPIFSIGSFAETPQDDKISLFGDGETVDGEDEEGDETTREIQLEEIEDASPAQGSAAPTRIRNREWEARKFLAKERVREARLKAQIADRLAQKEEARFYAVFGDLDDGESHFSDYDLTDQSSSEEDGEDSPM
jgi:hypothetical protein